MKKVYDAPEMEIVRFSLPDAILDSGLEETINPNGNIGGEGGDDIINLDDLG